MIVTLTSKGQLTLPKSIRERMRLDAGSKLDFNLLDDGTLSVRPMHSAASLFGIVKVPKGTKPPTLQALKDARADFVAEKNMTALREDSERQAGKRKR